MGSRETSKVGLEMVECQICGYIHCCEAYLERCENCGELISNHRDAEPVKEGE